MAVNPRITSNPMFNIWRHMHRRCQRKHHQWWDYYGRGITVCERWQSFDAFCEDMGERPSSDMSLERKDNDKGYSPENCVWATKVQQMRNRRNNIYVIVEGETLLLEDAVQRLPVGPTAIYHRMRDKGETHQQAIDFYLINGRQRVRS